jgi:hypothetical protein
MLYGLTHLYLVGLRKTRPPASHGDGRAQLVRWQPMGMVFRKQFPQKRQRPKTGWAPLDPHMVSFGHVLYQTNMERYGFYDV